jgi:hypothetical protein
MILNTIIYLTPDGLTKQVIVRDDQYDFHPNMPGIIIRPKPDTVELIPAGRLLSFLAEGLDPSAKSSIKPLEES